jgi:hypothetical protein
MLSPIAKGLRSNGEFNSSQGVAKLFQSATMRIFTLFNRQLSNRQVGAWRVLTIDFIS